MTHKSIVTMCVYDHSLIPVFWSLPGHEFVMNLKRITRFFSNTV
ncbi:hypothetical protein EMIT0P4_10356 [Pseudomonas sp. IT-P4]